jgi:UDP-GlcNAc:undecaprenyl-phosphate GlcNAc-1-phosphate transferase
VTSALLSGALALAVSLALGPAVLFVLRRGQVLDHPSERSSHSNPVPRGGGVAIALGALVAVPFSSSLTSAERWAVGVAAVLFGVIGLVEDVVGIRALYRLAVQFPVAGVAGVLLLERLTGPALWRSLFALGAVFFLVAFVNAYNFMDGIDGISVAQAVGAGVTWLAVGLSVDTPVLAAGGAIVAGAALGFAPFNLLIARMFLGDVGSYFVGAWLASVAILGLRAGVAPEAVLAPLALYVADTGVTLVRRVARGECWYLPHRQHAYQRLGDGGWSHVRTSALVAACIGVCGLLGAVSLGDSLTARVAADLAIAGVIVCYLLAPRWVASRVALRLEIA